MGMGNVFVYGLRMPVCLFPVQAPQVFSAGDRSKYIKYINNYFALVGIGNG